MPIHRKNLAKILKWDISQDVLSHLRIIVAEKTWYILANELICLFIGILTVGST